jgi:hypothetical protein
VTNPAAAHEIVSCEIEARRFLAGGTAAPGNITFTSPEDTCRLIREVFGNPPAGGRRSGVADRQRRSRGTPGCGGLRRAGL